MTYVPLSRSYLHTPWPIAAFNVMSKPSGAGCNLACEYCFYRHNQRSQNSEHRSQESEDKLRVPPCDSVVNDQLLEHFIAEYISSQDNPTVFFAWQGGEPTLAGLDFYRRVIAFQQKHARKGVTISNALQTNGVLLDEDWCQFLSAKLCPALRTFFNHVGHRLAQYGQQLLQPTRRQQSPLTSPASPKSARNFGRS